jgi:hypothetical protein
LQNNGYRRFNKEDYPAYKMPCSIPFVLPLPHVAAAAAAFFAAKKPGHNKRSCKKMTTPVSAPKIEAETDVKVIPPVKVEMSTITICTEENPQVNEVEFILKYLEFPCKVRNITASVKGDIWDGTFLAETDNPSVNVVIILVKGSGSFVDYIVYDNTTPDEKTVPILLMESTKTTDSESRNTAINQRFTKFAVAKQRFPSTPLILYYNTVQVTTTATSLFGRRLLTTFGVKAYDVKGKNLLADSPPFTSVEEIMKEKNAFKEKKGNISVKITLSAPHTYTISAKLSKGKNTTICHDPNKGLITGIASAIYRLDKEAKFLITNHCVAVDQIKKTTDKFWYANSAYDLKLEGCNSSSKGIACPFGYWSRDSKSEKASTINYQNHMEKNGWTAIYHNHSSSARSHFMDSHGKEHQVPKCLTIPDVVMVNKEKRCIKVCEGKILKDCFQGVKQLENLTNFIKYLETHYIGYNVERGLCLYGNTFREIESVKKQLSYPVFFALDSTGTLYY